VENVFALLLASPIAQLLWLPFMLASFGFVLVTFSGPVTIGRIRHRNRYQHAVQKKLSLASMIPDTFG